MTPAWGQALSRDISPHPIGAAATSTGPFQTVREESPGSVRAGWTLDVTHRPMDQYRCASPEAVQCSDVAAVVIGQRAIGVASGAVALTHRTWLELDVPVVGQWNGDAGGLSPRGVSLGDPRVGVRSRLLQSSDLSLDAYASVSAPVGVRGQWFAEPLPTGLFGATLSARGGVVTGLLDVGGWLRADARKNEWEFDLGSSLLTRAGLNIDATKDVHLWTAATLRASADAPAAVAWLGTAIDVSDVLRADVGVGRAVLKAPGAGPLHARVTFTFTHARPEPDPATPVARLPTVDPSAWPPSVRYRVRSGQLELRDPFTFQRNGTHVAAPSYPNLMELARWLRAHPDVGHVLIAAYASTAASSSANYTLSLERAQGLVDDLVAAGVPRSRLSYKGMGMLSPDAEAGEHTVVVDGQPQEHITLAVEDVVAPLVDADTEPFVDWLTRQQSEASAP